MADVNKEVKDLLEKGLDGVTVAYQYPNDFNNLPVVTYYTLLQKGSFAYDNMTASRSSTVVLDIWADYPKICAEIAEEINALMSGGGWYHEFERDVPNTDSSVKHKTMRFTKIFDYERND